MTVALIFNLGPFSIFNFNEETKKACHARYFSNPCHILLSNFRLLVIFIGSNITLQLSAVDRH